MHRFAPHHWAVLGALTIVLSSTAFAVTAAFADGGDPGGATSAAGAAGASSSDGSRGVLTESDVLTPILYDIEAPPDLSHVPPLPLEDGVVPTRSEAMDFDKRFSRFLAKGTAGLDQLASDGHLSGRGTTSDPYVLDRFYVDGDLTIQSTERSIVLRNGYVNGQLSLNYVGDAVYVHHVYAKDLRVNENVERSGINTGGLWHDNVFGFVGQIRHFTGEFRDNTIGPKPSGIVTTYVSDTGAADLPDDVVFNFDGFHGAHVHHNMFHGMVDIKLHGHNHGDCFACPIHHHQDESDFPAAHEDHDHSHDLYSQVADTLGFHTRHSVRYHSLLFADNTITVDDAPVALRYNDRNHAGDDQTANSEPHPALEDAHVHFQDITLRDNTITGGTMLIDVFNARDERHSGQNRGILRITGNTITTPFETSMSRDRPMVVGLDLQRADGLDLLVAGNTIDLVQQEDELPAATLRSTVQYAPPLAGIRLDTYTVGHASIADNTVTRGDHGVYARTLGEAMTWTLAGNTFHTTHAYSGHNVANAPGEPTSAEDGQDPSDEGTREEEAS